MFLALALTSLLAVQASAGPVAPASQQNLTERLIAALPEMKSNPNDTTPEPRELARLTQLNPGREAQIRPILEEHRGCSNRVRMTGVQRLLRRIVERLGDEKVNRLITFYEGPDYPLFNAIAVRKTTSSQADTAELNRIASAYPVMEFGVALAGARSMVAEDKVLVAEAIACSQAKRAALVRARLRDE